MQLIIFLPGWNLSLLLISVKQWMYEFSNLLCFIFFLSSKSLIQRKNVPKGLKFETGLKSWDVYHLSSKPLICRSATAAIKHSESLKVQNFHELSPKKVDGWDWCRDGLAQKFLPGNEPNWGPQKKMRSPIYPPLPILKFLCLFLNALQILKQILKSMFCFPKCT